MNKKKTIISILVLLLLIFYLLNNYLAITSNIINNFRSFWIYSFPPLFLSMNITNLIIYTNIPFYISKLITNYSLRIFILSLLMGFPNNISLLKQDYINGLINEKDLSYLITFTTVTSPIYVISIFKRITDNYLLFIFIYYFINIIKFLILFKKIHICSYQIKENNTSLIKGVQDSFKNILNILSIILFFSIFTILPNNNYGLILNGLIEFTTGLNSLINSSITKKGAICLMILLFNSLSIHMQLCYFLKDFKINYKYYYLSRLALLVIMIIQICVFLY